MKAIKHYRVTLDETSEPKGFASAAIRGCMCCGSVLSGMGGGGLYLCQDCLDNMNNGKIYDALHDQSRHERQLQQAHRAAEESAKDAYRRGWEQAKGEAVEVAKQTIFPPPKSYYTLGREDAAKAIASMEYKEAENGK